jgi:hypothetical protein
VADAEDRDRRHEFLDRSFELQKQVATLSTAASLLILAVYRERPFEGNLLAVTLALLALCALLSVHGMTTIALDEHRPGRVPRDPASFDRYVRTVTTSASNLLTAAVVVFALFLFDVPFWWAVGVLAMVLVVLLLLRWRRIIGG